MIITIIDNELIYNFDNEYEAFIKYIDILYLKFNFLRNLVQKNNNLNIPDFSLIKMFFTTKSYVTDIIYLDINDLKFKNYIDNTDLNLNLSDNEKKIILKKLNLLKNQKCIVDTLIVNNGIFIQNNKNFNTYSNDNTSDTISNITIDLESIKINSESCSHDTNFDSNDINLQKEKIEKLLSIKNEIEHKKEKKEKIEEILRRFKVDLEIYLKIIDKKNIPELFKYKFEVFKEMDELNIINNLNEAKKYYIKNFNRINKNIGSTIYGNIFNQIEAEEN